MTPPPMTTTSGLKTLTMLVRPTPSRMPEQRDDVARGAVAVVRELGDQRAGDRPPARRRPARARTPASRSPTRVPSRAERRARHDRLQAADVPARARRPVHVDDHVAELPGRAVARRARSARRRAARRRCRCRCVSSTACPRARAPRRSAARPAARRWRRCRRRPAGRAARPSGRGTGRRAAGGGSCSTAMPRRRSISEGIPKPTAATSPSAAAQRLLRPRRRPCRGLRPRPHRAPAGRRGGGRPRSPSTTPASSFVPPRSTPITRAGGHGAATISRSMDGEERPKYTKYRARPSLLRRRPKAGEPAVGDVRDDRLQPPREPRGEGRRPDCSACATSGGHGASEGRRPARQGAARHHARPRRQVGRPRHRSAGRSCPSSSSSSARRSSRARSTSRSSRRWTPGRSR